ncbi:MAG: MliC family protein [Candidatus Berkiella sp.]
MKNWPLIVIGLVSFSFCPHLVAAITPEFWEISSSHVVNMYDSNHLHAKVVDVISTKAQKLRNLGCKGLKIKNEVKQGWCKVDYRDKIGWIESRYLKPYIVDTTNESVNENELSVNCTHISYRVDKLICHDARLKKLEEQMSQLYAQAIDNTLYHGENSQLGDLIRSQKDWVNQRNECWRSQDGIENCVTKLYESRLNALKAYQNLKKQHHASQFICEDGTSFILNQFDDNQDAVAIEYEGEKVVLIATPTEFGTKFGQGDDRYIWFNAKDAVFVWDEDTPVQHCERQENSL